MNRLRKLGGSCNVSSDALAAYKRETDKQKPKHPREKAKIGGKQRRRRRRPISLLLHLSSNVQDAIWRLALEMHYWPSDELLGEAQKVFFASLSLLVLVASLLLLVLFASLSLLVGSHSLTTYFSYFSLIKLSD